MGLMSPAYAGCDGAAVADGPLPFGDIVVVLLTVGVIGYGIYQAAQAPAISIPKVEEKSKAIVIPKEPDSPVIFPVAPNTFNPVGLVKVLRAGTKNGAFISWMDPLTNTEAFRWDENPNYSNGSHYSHSDKQGGERYNAKIDLTFLNIGVALAVKGEWSGNRETIISLTVEEDFSYLQNYLLKYSEYMEDSLYLLFQMFSGDELHIVSKEVIVEIIG